MKNMVRYAITPMPPAVRALIQQAEQEFKDLVTCRGKISGRITKLNRACRLLSAVQNCASPPCLAFPVCQSLDKPLRNDDHRNHIQQTRRALSANRNEVNGPNLQLKRACRIALMEASGSISLHELYDRIERRGSFDFSACSHPLDLLGRALGDLVSEEEAQVIGSARGKDHAEQRPAASDRVNRLNEAVHTADRNRRGLRLSGPSFSAPIIGGQAI
jgi:hypothetical protein